MAGSWEKLAEKTLDNDASPLSVTFTAKKYLKFEARVTQSSTGGTYLRFNNISSGGKYGWRYAGHWNPNGNRGNEIENQTSRDQVQNIDSLAGGSYWVCDILNIQGKEKLFHMQTNSSSTTGADADLMNWEYAGKFASDDQITRIDFVKESGKNDFTAGSSIIVWGSDDQPSTAKDKSSITNVPAGTRYEETDTRKIFRAKFDPYNTTWIEKGSTGGFDSKFAPTRGVWAGRPNNTIDYITIQTTGNATDFGDSTITDENRAGAYSFTRGVFAGGENSNNAIDYVTVLTTGNATNFGDLITGLGSKNGVTSLVRGCFGGGDDGSATKNIIEYVTIDTTGDGTDFGDLTAARNPASCDDKSRGCFCGGYNSNVIDYITISSTGNATDFGDLTRSNYQEAGLSDSTRGVIGGGNSSNNTMDYFTIQTTGNATDFGDLTVGRGQLGGLSDATRGVFGGGSGAGDDEVMDYITIQTTGNATDFGDLSVVANSLTGVSG